eukprot:TRINITY_DN7596_c0_g1_i10.p1 TRINITY_DN7596_c0_g1~~TRINITY_DN7596_c0_g1_i10.p1  ORF type:complete len:311 (-),score=54.18 TRINITY_DN7596_c0_g1_i10:1326-2258(-)
MKRLHPESIAIIDTDEEDTVECESEEEIKEDTTVTVNNKKINLVVKGVPYSDSGNSNAPTELKSGHEKLPLWVTEDGQIFLEAFSPFYSRIIDFVVAIAEPLHRTHLIHEYRITKYSLYAAVSIGLSSEMILKQLNLLSKTPIPADLFNTIRDCTKRYGKVKLVLQRNGYSVESVHKDLLVQLLSEPIIGSAAVPWNDNLIPPFTTTPNTPRTMDNKKNTCDKEDNCETSGTPKHKGNKTFKYMENVHVTGSDSILHGRSYEDILRHITLNSGSPFDSKPTFAVEFDPTVFKEKASDNLDGLPGCCILVE